MKTFAEFLTEEPVLVKLAKHYQDVLKRNLAPHPARARRMKRQDIIDKFKLHYGISQDLSIPSGKRRKHDELARRQIFILKRELGI